LRRRRHIGLAALIAARCARNLWPPSVPHGDVLGGSRAPQRRAHLPRLSPVATHAIRTRRPGNRPATRNADRDRSQVHPGASPEVLSPSAFEAVPRCPDLPRPGRARFSVYRPLLRVSAAPRFRPALLWLATRVLGDLPPIPCPVHPGLHDRSTAAPAPRVIHRRFLRGRCSRPEAANHTAVPRATHPRRRSWGLALRSFAPARRSRSVSRPPNPPAVS
jgi:hypothetical protein